MGKKLTTWERSRREREKKEKAAASRAETAARRAKERERKEKLSDLQTDLGDAIVSLFNIFMKYLGNLTLAVNIKKISAQENLEIPKSIFFDYPGDLTYSELKSNIDRESFNPNIAIAELKRNLNMKYESYRSNYGSFFGNLFGKTKKDYESFIKQTQIDYNQISEKDRKRKEDFDEALRNYEEELLIFNKKANDELSTSNKNRRKQFDKIQSEIHAFNISLVATKKEIDNIFNLVTADGFDSLFGSGLPISFTNLDSTFDELSNLVKEFKKYSYESPSKNLKYGLSIFNDKLHLFMVYNDSYFPIPFDKQINSIKSGYSIQPLTKANREKIERNLIPSASLLYAVYAFNTSKGVKDLILSIGKETIDKKTGTNLIEWERTLSIDRSKLMSLKFENIEPLETLGIFSIINDEPFTSKIKWFDNGKNEKHFHLKLQEMNRLYHQIILLVDSFNKEKFSVKIPEDIKKLMERIVQKKG